MPLTAMEGLIEMFPLIEMVVNRKGGLYVHGTKFINLFRYILIIIYKSQNLIDSRTTDFMHA